MFNGTDPAAALVRRWNGEPRSPTAGLALLAARCGSDEAEWRTEAVTFRADAGTGGQEILDLEGLTLRGYCDRKAGRLHLTVTATTADDDAVLGSRFTQGSSPYTFVLDDFDADFGEYDLLGKASDETAGTLNYLSPDGSEVAVDYTAAQDTPDADCVFGGVATHAP
jgi:hypothetical protein